MDEFLKGSIKIAIYFVVCASAALTLKTLLPIPYEVFRKLLHSIFIFSIIPIMFSYGCWYLSVLFCILLVIIVYPVLTFLEKYDWYSSLLSERKKGEIKRSLILAFLMFSIVISVCCGIFDDKYLVLASIFAWGPGDAAAALVGKKYGRDKIKLPHTDGKKSVQGTCAMLVVSFIFVLALLLIRGGLSIGKCFIISVLTSFVSAVSELYSKNGNDTIFCPVCSMLVLILTIYII